MRLEVNGVRFSYDSQPILDDVSLNLMEGELLSLIGPNGSGKTTLLKCINKILRPRQGIILIEGRNVAEVSLKELARSLGYVPQGAAASFSLMVFDIILLGRKPHVNWGIGKRDRDIVFEVIELLGLHDMAFRMFNELSGGEKQKVLIARALAQEPRVLLLDEPTSNLDMKHQLEVLAIVAGLVKERGISAIMAIHDLNLASMFSDKTIMLKNGVVYAAGDGRDILTCHNIREVYGVETTIISNGERSYVVPLSPLKKGAAK